MAVALIKWVPYRIFAKTHILVVPVFLALGFHFFVLMPVSYWAMLVGWVNAGLIAVGTLCGLIALVRFTGVGRAARAKVLQANYCSELRVVEAEFLVKGKWPGHRPGQFAFVTSDWAEGPQPFTIATAWSPKTRRIGFIAKELGAYTFRLQGSFEKGHRVLLDGLYGQFTFEDAKPRHIWVGGGVAISPFVARMRQLGVARGDKIIDLFHTTSDVSEAALSRMRADDERAGVRLDILSSSKDGRLDASRIMAAVQE